MQLIYKIWIFYNAIFYAGIGVFTFCKPLSIAATMGFNLTNNTAIAELKASYGGLLIVLSVIMLIAYLKLPIQVCLGFITLLYLGYASGRLTGILLNGAWDRTSIMFFSIELSSLLISALLYYKASEN